MATSVEAIESKGLKAGALGLVGSIVIGIASTAPAYSLAASLGYVVIVAERRRDRGRQGAADHGAGLRPDVLHRGRLLRAEQGRAGLRHHVHLGRAGVRHPDRLDGRLGHHRRRRHRDGEPGPDRRLLLVQPGRRATRLAASTFWSTVAGVVWIVVMTYICYRGHRGLGPAAVRPARRRGGHAGRRSRSFALVKVYAGDAPAGHLKPVAVAGSRPPG